MTPKVFCIGFHKTGTKSLADALATLGYRVTGPNGVGDAAIARNALRLANDLVTRYDAFQDNPWPVLYREMDESYPGSRFILTLRDPQAWIASQVRHFGLEETPMRRWIYGVGCPQGNEAVYLRRYERHNEEVQEHFAGRPDDLLVMDLATGDGWSKLCPFLGKPVPGVTFPHLNRAEDRRRDRRRGAAGPSRLATTPRPRRRDLSGAGRGGGSAEVPPDPRSLRAMTREDAGLEPPRRPGSSLAGPEILAVHIPKAAGTAFDSVLESAYGKEQVERDKSSDTPRSLRGDRGTWRARMEAEAEPRTSWPRVITGHFTLRKYERFRRSAFTIVWLREPAERLLSQYFYWRSQWSTYGAGAAWARAFPPERIMEVAWPSNRVTDWFLPGYRLDDFDFVGIQEHFAEDIADLGRILGWPPVEIPVHNRNTASEYLEFRPTEELLRKIREANQADVELYERALERRRARRSPAGATSVKFDRA